MRGEFEPLEDSVFKRIAPALAGSLFLAVAQAQTPEAKPEVKQTPPAPSSETPRVAAVMNADTEHGTTVNLKHKILVDVAHLDRWADKPANVESIILFLDGQPLKKVTASVMGPAQDAVSRLGFYLYPDLSDAEEQRNWRRVLIAARRADQNRILVSVGVPGKEPIASTVMLRLNLQRWYSYIIYAALLALAVLVVVLARRSDLLRDSGPPPPDGRRRPYSLARTQMAAWFLLVLASWCYISLMTQSAAPLTNDALILMGISAATGLTALMVDADKWTKATEKRESLKTEAAALVNRLDGSQGLAGLKRKVEEGQAAVAAKAQAAVPSNLGELEKELQAKENRLAQVRAELAEPEPAIRGTKGWIRDILSDSSGISFHRLQIFVWTVALGVYFLWTSLRDLVMPVFDNQMLILMGISSGTYLGFKLPEKVTEEQAGPGSR